MAFSNTWLTIADIVMAVVILLLVFFRRPYSDNFARIKYGRVYRVLLGKKLAYLRFWFLTMCTANVLMVWLITVFVMRWGYLREDSTLALSFGLVMNLLPVAAFVSEICLMAILFNRKWYWGHIYNLEKGLEYVTTDSDKRSSD